MNSLWLVITALAAFLVAYRFYGAFLAAKVAVLNDQHVTPAHRLRDDVDYHPTRRLVLFGVHFAAIAGPGPLVGPGAGVAMGLFSRLRLDRDRRLPGRRRSRLRRAAGLGAARRPVAAEDRPQHHRPALRRHHHPGHAVHHRGHAGRRGHGGGQCPERKRLGHVHHRRDDPGRAADRFLDEQDSAGPHGRGLADRRDAWCCWACSSASRSTIPACGDYLLFTKPQLSIILPIYAAIASILPVWVLLCPRDYLSSYMKIGVIVVLAVGIFVAHPS